MCITDEEKKILFDSLKSIQRSLDIKIDDMATDEKLAKERFDSQMQAIGQINTNLIKLTDSVNSSTGQLRKEHKEAVEVLSGTAENLTEQFVPKKNRKAGVEQKAQIFLSRFFKKRTERKVTI